MGATNISAASARGDGTSELEDKDVYTVGWICALHLEMAAANLMLDKVYDIQIEQDDADNNSYILGLMKGHNVVIACLPDGVYGTNPAATVAKDMLRTFKSIRFGLMVGVGGGAPSLDHDIRLGDVVVSKPTGTNGGVIQYDRGKTKQHEELERTGSLNAPPNVLLTAVGRLRARHLVGDSDIPNFLLKALEKIKKPKIRQKFSYQGKANDRLFRAEFEHANDDSSCEGCDSTQVIDRENRDDADPVVHYGNIASGNQVIKDGETRDRLSKELGVLCFEMEAAGLMQEFPCLVIRGICDYSDSHKNKGWQEYAAVTAAAYAKELLSVVTPQHVEKEKHIFLDPHLYILMSDTKKAIQNQAQEQEIRYEDSKNQKCLSDLFQTESVNDRKRIIRDKGGLLEGSCQWILDLPEYQHWKKISHGSRLWINGDPGKGKTMLMCGILESLEADLIGEICYYFFCQATDSRLNTATAVIRGLIHQLARQHPWILSKIRERYDTVGKTLFEDANAWHALSEILLSSFQDSRLEGATIVMDALDECVTDRGKLLGFVQASSRGLIKWIVSSRHFPDIREALESKSPETEFSISLEQQQDRISSTVQKYIKNKVEELASKKQYDESTRAKVETHLSKNANNTFLWVALVCQRLSDIQGWKVEMVLHNLPKGLTALYRRMLHDVSASEDGILPERMLAILSVLERPVALWELPFIIDLPSHISDNTRFVEELLGDCGSFLILRDGVVRFIHQSAVEFLRREDFKQSKQFEGLSGVADRHYSVFQHSLGILCQSGTLKRDIYGLEAPGSYLEDIKPPEPDQLACLNYSCVHWVDHLHAWMIASKEKSPTMSSDLEGSPILDDLRIIRKIHGFLRIKFLYWIEAFILLGNMSKGIQAIQKLETLIEPDLSTDAKALSDFIRDANRFVLYNSEIIEKYPLQLYASSLAFSPQDSIVKKHFGHDIPDWIVKLSGLHTAWSACLQTLTNGGHSGSLAFSNDRKWLASTSFNLSDLTPVINIWEARTGILMHTLQGNFSQRPSISFSGDSKKPAQLSIASGDDSVQIWDPETGTHLRTFYGRPEVDVCTPKSSFGDVMAVAFSFDNCKIASHHADGVLVIWDAESGEKIHNLPGHLAGRHRTMKVAFSPDNSLVAAFANNHTVSVWKVQSAHSPQTLGEMIGEAFDLSFSSDSRLLAVASCGNKKGNFCVWDILAGSFQKHVVRGSRGGICLAFSHKAGSRHLAVATGSDIDIWDLDKATSVWKVSVQTCFVYTLSFSPDDQRLASGGHDNEIQVWDVSRGPSTPRKVGVFPTQVASSPDGRQAIYYDQNANSIRSRKIETEWQDSEIPLEEGRFWSLALSNDRSRIACATNDEIRLFNATNQALMQTISISTQSCPSIAFQHNNQIASASLGVIKLWDDGVRTFDMSIDNAKTTCFAISRDGKYLAYAFDEPHTFINKKPHTFIEKGAFIQVWDMKAGQIALSLHVDYNHIEHVVFSSDNQKLAVAAAGNIQSWDVSHKLCLWTLRDDTFGVDYAVSFDTNISGRLHTQFGFVDLNLEFLDHESQETSMEKKPFSGYGIGLGRTNGYVDSDDWIMRDGQKVLWVPVDYQWDIVSRDMTPFMNGTTLIWAARGQNMLMRIELKGP